MSKFIIFITCLFIVVSVTAETVYKKIKPNGSIEFTDRQSKDSQTIKIRKPVTYHAPSLPSVNLPSKKLSPAFNYSLKIIQPKNGSSIVNSVEVVVSIEMQPAMKKGYGHQLHYQLAGQSIKTQSASVVFKNISRGAHEIRVSIINKNNEVVSPVVTSTFHMKRFFKKKTP